ncbi:MAG TPA: hypothetical protein VH637_24290 [Streptosporangiaceae bacterium]
MLTLELDLLALTLREEEQLDLGFWIFRQLDSHARPFEVSRAILADGAVASHFLSREGLGPPKFAQMAAVDGTFVRHSCSGAVGL